MRITINYDDHPEEITEKFQEALKKLGISCEMIDPENEDSTSLEYEISLTKDIEKIIEKITKKKIKEQK